jgi:IS5 family transposase
MIQIQGIPLKTRCLLLSTSVFLRDQVIPKVLLTKGKKIRTDGTVVATNIHFPSDNSLLADGVKVISRMLSQAKKIMLLASKKISSNLFRNRSRTARRISRKIDSWSKMRNSSDQQRRKQAYIQLIEVTKASLKQAQKVKMLLEPLNSPLREDW